MIVADLRIKPLPRSKYHVRVRVYSGQREMVRQGCKDGNVSGGFKAAHCGYTRPMKNGRIGDIYLFANKQLALDSVHEFEHAALHYTRDIRGFDLNEPNSGEYATYGEEKLCESMEHYVGRFSVVARDILEAASMS